MLSVISAFVLMKSRMMVEVFPPSLRRLWKKWELRAAVFLSLSTQITLISLGSRRKHIPNTWIKLFVWSAYVIADAIATLGLGILLNDIGDVYEHDGYVDANTEITAFWAPFFLLHLGGPDTITAYSLEDNELYLRHIFSLFFQTMATVLVVATAWNYSLLSYLSVPMVAVGFLKYVERAISLWFASSNKLRNSMLESPDPGPNYPKFMDEYCLKHEEGYHVYSAPGQAGVPEPISSATACGSDENGVDNMIITSAYNLFHMFKRLFADLILSPRESDTGKSTLEEKNISKSAFDVIAIELGLMYDMLYTKASVIYTAWGMISRCFTVISTFVVVLIFSVTFSHNKRRYNALDLSITYTLLGVAIVSEIYAILVILVSDWTTCLFSKHMPKSVTKVIHRVLNSKNYKKITSFVNYKSWLGQVFVSLPRWSNSVGQYNFLCHCLEEKPGFIRLFGLHKIRKKYRYRGFVELKKNHLSEILKRVKAIGEVKSESNDIKLRNLYTQKVATAITKCCKNPDVIKSINQVDFDETILIWHIATELCYYSSTSMSPAPAPLASAPAPLASAPTPTPPASASPTPTPPASSASASSIGHNPFADNDTNTYQEMSILLSRYMLYLLKMYPFLLPSGIGLIRLRDSCSEFSKFLEERTELLDKNKASFRWENITQGYYNMIDQVKNFNLDSLKNVRKKINFASLVHSKQDVDKDSKINKRREEACKVLLQVKIHVPPEKVKGDRSKSVLFEACRVSSAINEVSVAKERWEMIRDVWLEILIYGASQGRGTQHARQLRRGGELLTHVWLLMAHFGLTDQFQISEGHARARVCAD